jgi:amino acid transporter
LPGAGGLYSFTRYALGPLAGFICGILTLFQYLVMPAVMVVTIGQYLDQLVPDVPIYLWWLLLYTIFVLIHIGGVIRTLRITLALAVLTILILLVFYVSALVTGSVSDELLANVNSLSPRITTWLPKGWLGIFLALPSALWFYVAVELLPVAGEETHDVGKNMPRAVIGTILTLFLLSFLTLFIGSNVGEGASVIGKSESPLSDGFTTIFGLKVVGILIGLVALMTSFHAIIYAYGRLLFALSRAGYLPRWLSITTPLDFPYFKNLSRDQAQAPSLNLDEITSGTQAGRLASLKKGLRKMLALQKNRLQRLLVYLRNKTLQILNSQRQTPVRALIVGAVIGLIFAYFISNEESIIGEVLLNTALFTVAFSYMMVFASYIVLKREGADLPRPYNIRVRWAQ